MSDTFFGQFIKNLGSAVGIVILASLGLLLLAAFMFAPLIIMILIGGHGTDVTHSAGKYNAIWMVLITVLVIAWPSSKSTKRLPYP